MKRKEFGKLLAALRKSRRDEFFQPITQQKMSHLTGIPEQVLGNIERGYKVSLEPELLLALSKALRLSTREWREFLLAASGTNEDQLPASQPESNFIFNELFNSLAQIALPAFLVDSYDDIVAANNIILSLFEFSENLIPIAPTIPGGYNVIRFVFSNKSLFNSLLGKQSEKYLMQSIRFFRAISLPNRASPYYQYLLKSFQTDRDMLLFNQYFQRDMLEGSQDDYYFEGERFCIKHTTLGELDFYSPPLSPVSTSKGNLYLVSYLPASPATTQACALLAGQYGPGARKLAPWPEKKFKN
jgi:transcriptional regulator with XRE-family HTH domain